MAGSSALVPLDPLCNIGNAVSIIVRDFEPVLIHGLLPEELEILEKARGELDGPAKGAGRYKKNAKIRGEKYSHFLAEKFGYKFRDSLVGYTEVTEPGPINVRIFNLRKTQHLKGKIPLKIVEIK